MRGQAGQGPHGPANLPPAHRSRFARATPALEAKGRRARSVAEGSGRLPSWIGDAGVVAVVVVVGGCDPD